MSRRDAAAAGQRARHARARLQATLGEADGGAGGLLAAGQAQGDDGGGQFEYRGYGIETAGESQDTAGGGPPLRWRVGTRIAVVLGILAVAAGAVFWWQTASGRPEILPLNTASHAHNAGDGAIGTPGGDMASGSAAAAGPAEAGAAAPGKVVVHVSGAVMAPGVVTLPAGSRVHQAISAAGGAVADADLDLLNLALVAEDGQKIHVPRRGEQLPAGETATLPGAAVPADPGAVPGAGSRGAGGKININTAGVAELDALPKVGPVLAQRIIDWRKEHGPFTSVEELDSVDGVGPKMLEALLPLVTV